MDCARVVGALAGSYWASQAWHVGYPGQCTHCSHNQCLFVSERSLEKQVSQKNCWSVSGKKGMRGQPAIIDVIVVIPIMLPFQPSSVRHFYILTQVVVANVFIKYWSKQYISASISKVKVESTSKWQKQCILHFLSMYIYCILQETVKLLASPSSWWAISTLWMFWGTKKDREVWEINKGLKWKKDTKGGEGDRDKRQRWNII